MSATYIARSSAIAARNLGGEMMIMSALDSTLFSLNPLATAIWEAADGLTPLEDIVRQRIVPVYEVEEPVAQRDAAEFVEKLARHRILVVSDEPIPNPSLSSTA